ncbi:MAG: hypothetical protein SFW36_13940 [Leptolyngbyaceae cyanobacterium bins.59]|nr:hypothetical protein [Leptolyngbyaceae cyanobacterium bins.59]
MEITSAEAEMLAFDFLMRDLAVPQEDREWFTPLSSRMIGESWYVVEIGVEGVPDKWVLQVYDTGECDPSYTFNTPMRATDGIFDLEELPEGVANVIAAERSA